MVDRLAQGRVRPVEQLLLLAKQIHADGRGGIGRDGPEGLAVEPLENGELLKPGGIRRAALGNTFKQNRERSRAVGSRCCGQHGTGVAPALEECIKLGELPGAGGGGGILLKQDRQIGRQARRLPQAPDLPTPVHVRQRGRFGSQGDGIGEL